MATIRNRNGKWQAQVRIKGHTARTKSFTTKRDAERWARQTETEIEASALRVDHRVLDRMTVRDVLERYRREVTSRKRGAASENKRLDLMVRQPWAAQPLSRITPQTFSRYRDERLRTVSAGTVIRDLGLLRAIFEVARLEWDIALPENPVARVRKPASPNARDRRLQAGELEALLKESDKSRNEWLRTGILLAVETGMRRGEMLNLRWADICFDTGTLAIPVTKTGHARRIPLSDVALGLLTQRRTHRDTGPDLVFPISANAFRQAWERCKGRVAVSRPTISDLRFHDLRHEAVSRFFEMGLSVPEVALISGHRDPRMLFRYTHLRAEDLAKKMRAA
ncbi:tyrosine-type recombinase/integrase [Tropicimonas aquimaris]|uniref:Tyrosine-type recombinase/integrase n=1 Tax=Tropicimonas aquimaris TaxID=914152 RepID=A0ABW3IRB6_9RHOB